MIYDNILEIATKKNIPLRVIEQKAGLGNGIISKWKTKNPNIDSLMAVAKVLKVSVNRLIKDYEVDVKPREER